MARAENEAAIAAATRLEAAVVGAEAMISSEAYNSIAEVLYVDLGAPKRGSNAYVTMVRNCHLRGALTDGAINLQKVRLEQSLSEDSSYEELGSFTLKFKADKDHVIATVADFLRLFFVWKWAHMAAGSTQVAPLAGRPQAGTKGGEGNIVDGGRVYVTLGGLEQYMYLLFSVCISVWRPSSRFTTT
jgi:hypothetical protein